jgi:hypothetical protein
MRQPVALTPVWPSYPIQWAQALAEPQDLSRAAPALSPEATRLPYAGAKLQACACQSSSSAGGILQTVAPSAGLNSGCVVTQDKLAPRGWETAAPTKGIRACNQEVARDLKKVSACTRMSARSELCSRGGVANGRCGYSPVRVVVGALSIRRREAAMHCDI